MFESAEIGHKLAKSAYRDAVPALRAALLAAPVDLFEKHKTPVVVLISGQDGAGKGETINVLYEWMDPRFISTLAFSQPSDEERERPPMWRYWRSLPPKGRVGMFAGSWYSDPIRERIEGAISIKELDARAQQINRFEEMLVDEGALVLKFWFHLTKEGQKQRLKALSSDPRTAWRVTQWNWDRLKTYDQLQDVARHLLRVTNTAAAPWVVVEGTDDRYRCMTVGQVLLKAMQNKLAAKEAPRMPMAPMVRVDLDGRNARRKEAHQVKFASLTAKRATKTGDEAGITKLEQRISLASDFYLYDTPGILWPRIIVAKSGYNLAASGAIGRNAFDEEEVALELLDYLKTHYPALLEARFKLVGVAGLTDEALLAAICQKRGALQGGQKINLQKAAEIAIYDFRSGVMGRMTLETPEEFAEWLKLGQTLDAERQVKKDAIESDRKIRFKKIPRPDLRPSR